MGRVSFSAGVGIADLYFSHQSTGAVLWQQAQAQAQVISQTKVDALRLRSKLSAKALDLSICCRTYREVKSSSS
jgi:hypothetical protein